MRAVFIIFLISLQMAYGQQSMPELNAYRDYYDQAADFSLSFLRYKARGYDSRYSELYINGVSQNSLLTGTPVWGALGSQSSLLSFSKNGLSFALGGGEWLSSAPFAVQQGGRAVVAASNRTYSYRASVGYNRATKNGWAFSADASRRWGRSMTTDGVWADAWGAYFSAAKRLAKGGELTATMIFAPSERAFAAPATREAFELTGTNLYNPSWGVQDGEQRSARVRQTLEPIVIVNHGVKLSESLTMQSAVAVRVGRRQGSALGWQGAPNPQPDYFRYMPSAQRSEQGAVAVAELWRSDVNSRQIDYKNLYYINSINTPRAKYMMENRVENPLAVTAQSTIEGRNFAAGFVARYDGSHNYKTVKDLMGAEYWLDIDSYVEQDDDVRDLTQNNLRNPDRHVKPGDRFGYDYGLSAMQYKIWGEYTVDLKNWQLLSAAQVGLNTMQRRGYYEKENFASGHSYGFSQPKVTIEYAIRVGGRYRLGSMLNLSAAVNFENRAPTAAGVFVDARYRNAVAPESTTEKVWGAEVVGDYRSEKISARAAIHYAVTSDGTEFRSMYDDLASQYVIYAMYDISRRYLGLELSAELLIFADFYADVALFVQDNIYMKDPLANAYTESTGVLLRSDERVAYRGLHVAGSPQCAGVVALSYRPRGWMVRLSSSFFANNYIALAPLRRTFAGTTSAATPAILEAMTTQERLGADVTLDVFGGYTWRFGERSLGLYGGVNNILNNTNIVSAGYEGGRLRLVGDSSRGREPSASKYYYGLPINFSLNATYRF